MLGGADQGRLRRHGHGEHWEHLEPGAHRSHGRRREKGSQVLRGTAEERQVDTTKIAMQHNLGLGGACVVTMYQRS